jgi:hypothetical protein
MKNVLFVAFILFCSNCGVTATEAVPSTPNIPDVARPAPQMCEYSLDPVVDAIIAAGAVRADCMIGIDLGAGVLTVLRCVNAGDGGVRAPIPVPAEILAGSGPCRLSFDSPALFIRSGGMTRTMCILGIDLTTDLMAANCRGDITDEILPAPITQ